MYWYLQALRHYATFAGRARRRGYWCFALVNMAIVWGLTIAMGMILKSSPADSLIASAVLLVFCLLILHPARRAAWPGPLALVAAVALALAAPAQAQAQTHTGTKHKAVPVKAEPVNAPVRYGNHAGQSQSRTGVGSGQAHSNQSGPATLNAGAPSYGGNPRQGMGYGQAPGYGNGRHGATSSYANNSSFSNSAANQRAFGSNNGVNAHGDHAGGIHVNNGGVSSASQGDHSNPNFQSGQSGANAVYDGVGANLVNDVDSDSGHPENGLDSNGTEWRGDKVWDGTDAKGTKWREGKAVGGTVKTYGNSDGGVGDDPDIGPQGGGTLVSGTGKGVNPGHRNGQDGGRGPGTGDAPTGGGTNQNSATGGYVVTGKYGQDTPVKPRPSGPMTNSYNGVRGATDPKRGAGGG